MTRTSPIETNNVVERLRELLVAINEPQPKPLPEDQTSRAAEAMAGREDQRRYGLWRDRINEAQRQLVALVPELLTERQSLSDHIDVQSALLGRARWLMRPYCGADEALRIFCDDVTASLEACNAKR